jgi:RimJ/RimL family protein N-acetyltransferase
MTNNFTTFSASTVRRNYPGFDYPLEFCPMLKKHKPEMIRAVWKSHKDLRGFIGWAKYARSWNGQTIGRFVDDHINDPLPNQHFIFRIGSEVVGVGSLVKSYTNQDCQIALWVTSGYQGKGIGKQILNTLEAVAFEVWGFTRFFYEHDARNESSKKLPQKCGFAFSHTFDTKKSAQGESGFWMSWVKYRPNDLPPGILQGRDIDDFTNP